MAAANLWADGPWKCQLECTQEKVDMVIDLYEESVDVPGMSMFGPMNGYINGKGVYGVWMVTSFEIKSDSEAIIRFSNDLGSDTQNVRLTRKEDGSYLAELTGTVYIKKVVNGKKLEKIVSKLPMTVRKKQE